MEFMAFGAPVFGAVEFGTLEWVSVVAQLVALAPLWLLARRAVGFGADAPGHPQLRVIEGGRETDRRAA